MAVANRSQGAFKVNALRLIMMKMRSVLAVAFVIGGGLSAAGCGLGDGTGAVAGTLFLRGCTHEADYGIMGAPAGYDMKPSYFVAVPINALASSKPLHLINK